MIKEQRLKMTELILEKVKIGLQREFPAFAKSLKFDINEYFAGRIIADFRGYLLGEKVLDEKIVKEYPASWWQHFKQDVLKLKKIKYNQIKINIKEYRTYPHININVPDEWGAPIIHQQIEQEFIAGGIKQ